jgi:hypothetical protein
MRNPLVVSKLKYSTPDNAYIVFPAIDLCTSWECARACRSGEWLGKELHTLLVKSPIYVNLGTYYIRGKRTYIRRQTNWNDEKSTRGDFIYTRSHKSLMFKLFAILRYKKRIKQKSIIEIP